MVYGKDGTLGIKADPTHGPGAAATRVIICAACQHNDSGPGMTVCPKCGWDSEGRMWRDDEVEKVRAEYLARQGEFNADLNAALDKARCAGPPRHDAPTYGPARIETPLPPSDWHAAEDVPDKPNADNRANDTAGYVSGGVVRGPARTKDGIEIPAGWRLQLEPMSCAVLKPKAGEETISIEPGREYKTETKIAWECNGCGHAWRGIISSECPKCSGGDAGTGREPSHAHEADEPFHIVTGDTALTDCWLRAAQQMRGRSILADKIPTQDKVRLSGGMTAHGMRNL